MINSQTCATRVNRITLRLLLRFCYATTVSRALRITLLDYWVVGILDLAITSCIFDNYIISALASIDGIYIFLLMGNNMNEK